MGYPARAGRPSKVLTAVPTSASSYDGDRPCAASQAEWSRPRRLRRSRAAPAGRKPGIVPRSRAEGPKNRPSTKRRRRAASRRTWSQDLQIMVVTTVLSEAKDFGFAQGIDGLRGACLADVALSTSPGGRAAISSPSPSEAGGWRRRHLGGELFASSRGPGRRGVEALASLTRVASSPAQAFFDAAGGCRPPIRRSAVCTQGRVAMDVLGHLVDIGLAAQVLRDEQLRSTRTCSASRVPASIAVGTGLLPSGRLKRPQAQFAAAQGEWVSTWPPPDAARR